MADVQGISVSIAPAAGQPNVLVKDRPVIGARLEKWDEKQSGPFDDLPKFMPRPAGDFGAKQVVFETPEQRVGSELKTLKKFGEDSYFGKQRQYEELKQFTRSLNVRVDLNATQPDLMVWTTPRYAYSDKYLADMTAAIDDRLSKTTCPEDRALLEGMRRSIDAAIKERESYRLPIKFNEELLNNDIK